MRKGSMEKLEAWTDHDGEIWELGSDSAVSSPRRWVSPISVGAPRRARAEHGAASPGGDRGHREDTGGDTGATVRLRLGVP